MLKTLCLSCGDQVRYEVVKPKECPHCRKSIIGLGSSSNRQTPQRQETTQAQQPFPKFELEFAQGGEPEVVNTMTALDIEIPQNRKAESTFGQIVDQAVSNFEAGKKGVPNIFAPRAKLGPAYSIADIQNEGGLGQGRGRNESTDIGE
jgi:hypothetical protein